MKKETIIKIIDYVKVLLTVVAGFLGGAVTSSASSAIGLY